MDLRKPFYVHLVTALAAAGIAAAPLDRLSKAGGVGLVAGIGSAVAAEVAQRHGSRARALRSQIEELSRQIEEKEQQLRSYENQLDELRAQLQQREEKLQRLEADLAEYQKLLEQLETERQEWRQNAMNLSEQVQKQEQQLQGQQAELDHLRAQLRRRIEDLAQADTNTIVLARSERDFYREEAKSFILEILSRAADQVHKGSRVQHILQDLIQNNHANEGKSYRQRLREDINHLFRDYRKWCDNSYEAELHKLGFEVVSEKNYVVIRFHGDNRYQISLAKTPSDQRAGYELLKIFAIKSSV
jgi:DNA repair exonuclease SbcCD ATPase subunit